LRGRFSLSNSTAPILDNSSDQLEMFQELHMFRVTKVSAELFEFIYASQFRVSLPCVKFTPVVEKVNICRVDARRSKFKDAFPQLGDFWLRTAREHIALGKRRTITEVSQSICTHRPGVDNHLIDRAASWGLLVFMFSNSISTTPSCHQVPSFH
jgi:hypothetical protein